MFLLLRTTFLHVWLSDPRGSMLSAGEGVSNASALLTGAFGPAMSLWTSSIEKRWNIRALLSPAAGRPERHGR
eukprot:CAMPEP_0173431898 /NCGR_PEP_ID=MMETSP1357-20121228/9885_1 /TAXON_ID=77926 /ORGANISM="Hemiselmis rufescens, Strain PCC563" /LENGTH=72 /DNA_ID=CAMNT_0014396425 /DNA_START=102 /DNA_END=316 /DNA_ORIENTATION=-